MTHVIKAHNVYDMDYFVIKAHNVYEFIHMNYFFELVHMDFLF